MNQFDLFSAIPPILKHALDALATFAGIACAMVSAVNVVTALTIVWWALRIYEMPTVQRWLGKGDRTP